MRDISHIQGGTLSPDVERAHERRLRAAFEQSPLPQVHVGVDGRVLHANAALAGLLGSTVAELVGTDVLSHVEVLDELGVTLLADMLSGAGPKHARHEITYRDPDGRQQALLATLTVVVDEQGVPQGVHAVGQEVRELHQLFRQAQAARALFGGTHPRAWDGAIVIDAEARLSYVSPSVLERFGYRSDELVGRSAFDFIHFADESTARDTLDSALGHPDQVARAAARALAADGEWRWCDVTLVNALDDPDVKGLIATLRDTTDIEEARRELTRSEARYRAVVESSQAGIIALDADGGTLLANARIAEIMHLPVEDVYRRGLWHLFDADAQARARQRLRDPARRPERYVLDVQRGDGSPITVNVVLSPLSPLSTEDPGSAESSGWLVMVHDVTEERARTRELRRQALQDPLTGLANRVLLEDRLGMAAARQRRDAGHDVAVLYIDVDGLKQVNDSHGHAAGDALLVEVARRLEAAVRESDTVARLGGDEFAVVCEATDAEAVMQIAERMRAQLAAPVVLESGAQVGASASIGLATSPPRDAADLVALADVAMYAAKSSGAGVVTYDDRLADASARRGVVRSGLAEALGTGGLGVRYLRVVDLDDATRTSGLDIVPSWHHPDLGPLPSRELRAAARDAGLEPDLERHLLARACLDLRRLLDAGAVGPAVRVSVALSPGGLLSRDLLAVVTTALREHGLAPDTLELRVAESSMTPGGSGTVAVLRSVAELGVGLSVDRFGREPHSLWRLHAMPLTGLRVESPVVTAPGADRRPLLRSVLAVADALGLGVVATDVMTAAQADFLLRGGVARGQGLLFGSAVTVDALLPSG